VTLRIRTTSITFSASKTAELSHKPPKKNPNRIVAQYPAKAAHRTKKVCTQTGSSTQNIVEKPSRAEEKEKYSSVNCSYSHCPYS